MSVLFQANCTKEMKQKRLSQYWRWKQNTLQLKFFLNSRYYAKESVETGMEINRPERYVEISLGISLEFDPVT